MGQIEATVGSIVWTDLTVPDATGVSEFYRDVVGWQAMPHDMGDYHDFDIVTPDAGETVAGICHARGTNADIPAQWLIYITVADVRQSADRCIQLGGTVLDGPRMMGNSLFCVIRDPAGAVAALIEA